MPEPFRWLKQAAHRVPVLWYALALAGVAFAVFVAQGLLAGQSLMALFPAAVLTVVCMVLLIIANWVLKIPVSDHRPLARLFAWTVCLAMCAMIFLSVTAVAFGWPGRWADRLAPVSHASQPSRSVAALPLGTSTEVPDGALPQPTLASPSPKPKSAANQARARPSSGPPQSTTLWG